MPSEPLHSEIQLGGVQRGEWKRRLPVVGGCAVEVRVGNFEVAGDEGLKHDLGGWNAGDGERALGGAVVRHRAADNLVARRLAGELEVPDKVLQKYSEGRVINPREGGEVLLDELDCALHGFAAAGSEEDVIQITGRKRRLQSE